MKVKTKLLILFIGIFLCNTISHSQVLVYKVNFHDQKKGVNFNFYEGGYFVSSSSTGTGSFLFTISDNGAKTYIEATDAGDLFFAVNNKKIKSILRARSDGDDVFSSLLAIGKADKKVRTAEDINGNTEEKIIADKLTGYFIASDSEASQKFDPTDKNIGFAGISEVTLTLESARTKSVNQGSLTVTEVITELSEELEILGYVNENQEITDSETSDSNTSDSNTSETD